MATAFFVFVLFFINGITVLTNGYWETTRTTTLTYNYRITDLPLIGKRGANTNEGCWGGGGGGGERDKRVRGRYGERKREGALERGELGWVGGGRGGGRNTDRLRQRIPSNTDT